MSDFDNVLDSLNKEMADLKKKYQAKTQEIFKQIFTKFFEENPEVQVVSWTQYTPYFNDGDECVFRCGVAYAFASNAKDYHNISYSEYDGEEDGVWIDDPDYGDLNEELIPTTVIKSLKSLRNTLSSISDDVYLAMFDNHVKVYVTREGFETEHWEHD